MIQKWNIQEGGKDAEQARGILIFLPPWFTISEWEMTTKATKGAENDAHGAQAPARPCAQVPRVEEGDRLMLRGISLEDVLFPHCVPGAEGS